MMGQSLYDIAKELLFCEQMIEEWAEEHEGDITDFPLMEELEKLEMSRQEKALAVGVWHKNLLSDAGALKAEIKILTTRKRVLENKATRLKNFLQESVPQGAKFENSRCKISWRKSKALDIPVEIAPEDMIDEFKRVKTEFNLTAMKEEVKTNGPILIEGKDKLGENVTHEIFLETKQNIQVK